MNLDSGMIGARIREARKERGLTQEQLAEASGLSATYISNLERGLQTANLEAFASICNALRVSSVVLLQDVIDADAPAQTGEITALLQGQPPETQRMLLRMLKAAITQN